MTHRTYVSAVVTAILGLVFWCAPLPVAAQFEAGGRYVVPRTPYGHPDLQGFWTNQTYTRLERPDGVNKPFYTEEEVAVIAKRL